MGILDFLTGNNAAASPWGALYQQPAPKPFLDYSMGWPVQTTASPWGDPSQPSVGALPAAPSPLLGGFGGGATPFGFAGPGSNVVNPSQIAPPSPIGPPAPSQLAQAAPVVPPASDLSSVNRAPVASPAAPAADDGEDAAPPAAPVRPPVAPVVTGAPASAPFSLGGGFGDIGDRLSKGTRGFLGNLALGPLGAIAGGAGALLTGRETDPTAIASEQNGLTAQALLKKGASPAEVQAARYNPALQKALIEQYYGKDKWAVVQVGEDGDGRKTYMQQNQVDGTLRPIAGGPAASASADFVTGPDGKPIAIPPGVNRKEFIKQVTHSSADAATGKQTEAQAKSAKFSTIATQADSVIKQLEAQGQSVWGPLTDKLPLGGAYAQSPDYQRYKAAKEAFLGAHLRDVSGAAIGSNEYVRAERTFFPLPGEGPEAVAQKAALRSRLLHEMGQSAGLGYKPPGPSGTVSVGGSAINWSVK